MTDVSPEATAEIELLLADRQRLQGWLDRLEGASNRAPATVRNRVRADYEGRLSEVVVRLRGFSTALLASLETLRSGRAAHEAQRAEVEEVRAEAGLRHDVGEYTDEEWGRLEGDAKQNVAALTGEIDRLSAEIHRLDEVLAQVSPELPPPPRRELSHRPARDSRTEERLDIQVIDRENLALSSRAPAGGDEEGVVQIAPEHLDDIEPIRPEPSRAAPVEAPRFTPKPSAEPRSGRERGPARTIRFPSQSTPAEPPSGQAVDEMTFLKSVTLDSPASRERSAAEQRPNPSTRARSPNASKTLKCAECGSMNRPTEWYCERCGAELAAL